jgi:hypothetical protein
MPIRRGALSFIWLNSGPVGFRIARSGDSAAVRSRRTCVGRSQHVIKPRFIRSAHSASSTNFSTSERSVSISSGTSPYWVRNPSYPPVSSLLLYCRLKSTNGDRKLPIAHCLLRRWLRVRWRYTILQADEARLPSRVHSAGRVPCAGCRWHYCRRASCRWSR